MEPLARSSVLLFGTFMVGVVGYSLIGGEDYDLFDALYMTVITLTTIGFAETIDLSDNRGGRLFTVGLVMVGVGTFVYFISNVTAFLVEGSLERVLGRRRMDKRIAELRDHDIVCGAGSTGQHIIAELVRTRRPFVVIENNLDTIARLQELYGRFPFLEGDATLDEALESAGIGRARGLAACVSNDKDNLVIAFSARLLSAETRIVARASDPTVSQKMLRAGADAVISVEAIGGLRMASSLIRPTAVNFLDLMLREEEAGMRVEDLHVREDSPLVGITLADLRRLHAPKALVIAIHHGEDWQFNPSGSSEIFSGASLVVIADAETRASLEGLARP